MKFVKVNNIPSLARHFSGYFLANSSWARANLGHEKGVILPSTFKWHKNILYFNFFSLTLGLVILIIGGTGDCIFSIVIELFVWIDESVFSVFGNDNPSFWKSTGENVRWIFLFGSIEIYMRSNLIKF